MSELTLPEGWVIAPFTSCIDILDSQRKPVNNKERQERVKNKSQQELYPYFGATGQAGWIDDYLFDEELIALGEDGVPFLELNKKKAYMLTGKTWVNNHAHVLKAIDGVSINKYLLHYLNNFEYIGYVNGGTRLKLTQTNMKKIPINLPSLAEQKEIVRLLDSHLATVTQIQARLDAIPKTLEKFRQSVLNDAILGKLTEDINNSVEWKEFKLEEVSNILDPHPSHRTPKVVENGIPYIGIGNLSDNGTIDFLNARKVSRTVLAEHNERYSLKEGDFIFGKIGTLGKPTLLPLNVEYALSANVILVQPNVNYVNPEFLRMVLSAPSTMSKITNQSSATSQRAFGIKKMRSFKALIPLIVEQDLIVEKVKVFFAYADQIEKSVAAAKARVDNLTQSILHQAFTGQLTAEWREQNPELISGDNSAEALLTRIQAEG